MDRRTFLLQSALGSGALALARTATAAAPPAPSSSWAAVKAEFDRLAPDRIHMSSFFLVSHPKSVREAIEAHRKGLDLDPITYIEKNIGTHERAVHDAAAAYLGAKADEVAMTDSTTQGLGLVYGGLELKPGQEVLSTTHDHIVSSMAQDYRAARNGGTVRRIALYDEPSKASTDEMCARLAKAIRPETRIIGATWVHSGTGVKLPLRALADVIAKANAKRDAKDRALLVVDGVHGFGNQDFDVNTLGCDFFVAGCHKWIFGPRGTGLVWARPDAWPVTKAIVPSMDAFWRPEPPDQMPPAAYLSPGGFHSFEHRWALNAAFEMHQRLGKAKVAARVAELNTRCKQGLAKLPKVRVKTPLSPELSAGIVCFEVEGLTPAQVVERLGAQRVVASVTPPFYTPLYVRLAPSLVTLEADVDKTVAAVAAL
jgi:selenocysteine lyase/cysteine desulfurase